MLYLSRRVIPSNPTRNTFYQIQKISAGEISKNMQRGVSGGSPTASGRDGTALVGKADALRAFRVHKMVLAVRKAVKLTFVYSDFNHVRVPL